MLTLEGEYRSAVHIWRTFTSLNKVAWLKIFHILANIWGDPEDETWKDYFEKFTLKTEKQPWLTEKKSTLSRLIHSNAHSKSLLYKYAGATAEKY